jgi:hypothetical protein
MPLTGPFTLDPRRSLLTGDCRPPSAGTISSTLRVLSVASDSDCLVFDVVIGCEELCDRLRRKKRLALSRDRASVLSENRACPPMRGDER